jgi:uncharacterized protein YdeI (YjbR/CyaY-like superfamily)
MDPTFFPAPADLRAWLEENHASEGELWVGFYKVGTGRASITWPESVDEALCFGWIDGVRKKLAEESYVIRFTPRKPTSNWSAKNLDRIEELIAEGRVRLAGMRVYEARDREKEKVYSFERRREATLDATQEARFRANEAAWAFFQGQPPGYRRTATHWVISAKREATRERRLDALIEDSAAGRRVGPLRRPGEG